MASTLTPSKSFTSTTPLFTLQAVSSVTMAKGPVVDVTAKWAGTALIRYGRLSSVVVTNATEFRLESGGRGSATINDFWVPVYAWTTANHATAAAQGLLSAAVAAGGTKLELATATGLTAADGLLFLYDGTSPTTSEWFRILSVGTNSIAPLDTITRAHSATSSVVTDQAEEWAIPIDLATVQYLRMIVDNAKNAVAAPVMVEGQMIFHDAVAAT
jgi:hypothetical protein